MPDFSGNFSWHIAVTYGGAALLMRPMPSPAMTRATICSAYVYATMVQIVAAPARTDPMKSTFL